MCIIHKWSKWSYPVKGYVDWVQFSVCTKCGKQKYRSSYQEQVNSDEQWFKDNTKEDNDA